RLEQRRQQHGKQQRQQQPEALEHVELAEPRQQHDGRADAAEDQHHREDVVRQQLLQHRLQPVMMRLTRECMNAVSVVNMNGSSTRSETRIASIFGTKVSVISWIWVSA